MKKNYFKALLLILIGAVQLNVMAQSNPNFYLAPNGKTCMCPDADFDETGTLIIDGVEKTFTKRSINLLSAYLDYNPQNPEIALTCTSGITDMSNLFSQKSNFNQDISTWDVSSVTSMSGMFSIASSFNQDISAWDVSKVTDMKSMFGDASSFNQDISSWDVSGVIDMNSMFYRASSFNQPLNDWDISSVSDMSFIFYGASSFNQPLHNWNTSGVTIMNYMFAATSSFNQDISTWNVSNVTSMDRMFNNATNFNQDLSGWCVEQIPDFPTNFAFGSSLPPENYPDWGAPCETLSNEQIQEIKLSIFPNPVSDKLFVDYHSSYTFQSITIYNMLGRKVKTVNPKLIKDGVRVSAMKTGSYLIQFKTQGNQEHTKRFIVK
ncbi:MAG: BspA family leucine-rich repeat surface protein [Psychroflexus sp.]